MTATASNESRFATGPQPGSPLSRPARSTGATVLIVDDDRAILRTMDVNLRARRYDTLLAAGGRQALALAARRHPDIVVLDLGLPDMDGLDVIEGLRGWTSVPIIVLSARSSEAAKVAALDAGANDYMTKPFGIAEFMARLPAALRVNRPADEAPVLETADFTLDLAARRASRGGLRGPSDGHRMADRHVPGPQPRSSDHACAAARAGVGLARHQEQLRPRVPVGDPAQARARPGESALLPHRASLGRSTRHR